MKLFLIIPILFISTVLQAQTKPETLEWINAKKVDIMVQNSPTTYAQNFDAEKIFSYVFPNREDNNKYHRVIKWSDITDISFSNKERDILIKGRVVSASGENFMRLGCADRADTVLIEKFIKALKHMATLNGAKLVNDELF